MSRLFDDTLEGGAPGRLTNSPVQENIDLPGPDSASPAFNRTRSVGFDGATNYSGSPHLGEEDELAEMQTPISPNRRQSTASVWSTGRTATIRLMNPPTPGGLRRPPSRRGTVGGMSIDESGEPRFMVSLLLFRLFYLLTRDPAPTTRNIRWWVSSITPDEMLISIWFQTMVKTPMRSLEFVPTYGRRI